MLKIDFINVGYGDSILLRTFDRYEESLCILVDTGELKNEHYMESEIRVKAIDFLESEKVEKIDILIISHLHLDHVGGLLEIAEKIHVKELWVNYMLKQEFVGSEIRWGDTYTGGAKNLVSAINCYNKAVSKLLKKGTLIKEIVEPVKIRFSKFFEADILCCDQDKLDRQREIIDNLYVDGDYEKNGRNLSELDTFINNTSIVLDINYNNKKILLGANAYISYWDNKAIPGCDILKLPHHGHKDGVNKEIFLKMSPSFVVICVSNTRLDDCPSKECVKTMYQCVSPLYVMCTDAVKMPPFLEGEKQKSILFEIDDAGQICCKRLK